MKTKLPAIGLALLLLRCAAPAWTGDTWGNITRATIKSNADLMIDSTWVPKNTFTNWEYGTTYHTYTKGVVYTGVAYSQSYNIAGMVQQNWTEFYKAVTNTSGGTVAYGDDCSGFTSICWKLPTREVTSTFESKLGTTAKWYSLGDIGSAASTPLLMGDALNSSSVGHIVLFLSFETTGVNTMEQTPNNAQRKLRAFSNVAAYRPIRRMQIVEERGITVSGNLAYGNVMAGTSTQRTLTINSTGLSTLTVSNLSLPAGFAGNWSGTLAPGGSQNVTITFSPATVASYGGTLTVNSDAVAPTNTLSISGTGIVQAPQITSQPQSQTVLQGQGATFSVAAAGLGTLGYQWRFCGTNLGGATGTSLVLANLATNQSGPYTVVVTNSYGAVTSQVASLTVSPLSPTAGWSPLWRLAPGARPYLTVNALPYERGLACNPVTRRLLLVSRNGPHVYVLNADSGADLHELNVTGVSGGTYALLMIGVADDGAVYAGNLTAAGTTTAFKLYRWADDSPATVPTVAYSGDPGAGASQRWGDTLDVRGGGTNTQVLLASRSGNVAALLTTANGSAFTSKLITVADAPAGGFGLGLAFGAGNTFWGKATSQALRQVAFDLSAGAGTSVRVCADPSFPGTIGPIGVSVPLNLLAGINVGATGNNLRLYDLTLTNGTPASITATNFAADNDNTGSGTGSVDFSGNRVYALGANNGIVALQIVPAVVNSPPGQPGHFDAICRRADGALQLSLSCAAGSSYVLEWTSDWLGWSNVCTLAGTNGSLLWVDPCATNIGRRFYRLRVAP